MDQIVLSGSVIKVAQSGFDANSADLHRLNLAAGIRFGQVLAAGNVTLTRDPNFSIIKYTARITYPVPYYNVAPDMMGGVVYLENNERYYPPALFGSGGAASPAVRSHYTGIANVFAQYTDLTINITAGVDVGPPGLTPAYWSYVLYRKPQTGSF